MGITHVKVSAIADDAAAAARGEVVPSDWNAAHTITAPLVIDSGTITTSAPVEQLSQTWNAGAVKFTGWSINITNTASAAGSLIADWQVGGLSAVSITKNGAILSYGAYTDDSNYVRAALSSSSTAVTLAAETAGTGADVVDLVLTSTGLITTAQEFKSSAALYAGNDVGIGSGSFSADLQGVALGNGFGIKWSNDAYRWSTKDTGLMRNAAGVVEVNNGTAGTFRDIKIRNLLAGGGNGSYVQTPSMTVANLAAAGTAGAGARAFVTDATATTFLSTVAGGGANKVPVVSDGTNWLIG